MSKEELIKICEGVSDDDLWEFLWELARLRYPHDDSWSWGLHARRWKSIVLTARAAKRREGDDGEGETGGRQVSKTVQLARDRWEEIQKREQEEAVMG